MYTAYDNRHSTKKSLSGQTESQGFSPLVCFLCIPRERREPRGRGCPSWNKVIIQKTTSTLTKKNVFKLHSIRDKITQVYKDVWKILEC